MINVEYIAPTDERQPGPSGFSRETDPAPEIFSFTIVQIVLGESGFLL
jgi:hypothetical protein